MKTFPTKAVASHFPRASALSRDGLRGGYTLIELTIVLLIVAIMAAAAAPKYSQSLASFRLKSVAQRISADIRQARRFAQQNSAPQGVVFDMATNSYTLTGRTDLNRRSQTYRFSLAEAYECELVSADFGGSATLTFNVFGRPANGGTLVVRCAGITQTLAIDEIGQVTIL